MPLRILSVAWECPRGWYGGLGVFVSRFLPALASLGNDVVHVCTEGDFSGCVNEVGSSRDAVWSYRACRLMVTLPTKDMGVYVSTAVALASHALPMIRLFDAVIGHDIHGSLTCIVAAEQGVGRCGIYIHMPSGTGIEGDACRMCVPIANSRLVAEQLKKSYALDQVGIEPGVVYPAPPYEPVKEVEEMKFFSKPRIAILTRYQFNKDPGWVLETLNRLAKRIEFEAVLFGRGASLYGYEAPWLKVLDSVPEELKVELIAQSTLLIYPSRWEPFGLPPLEAIALGTPAVVHRNTGVAEVLENHGVVDDETGLEELLEDLLRDPSRCLDLLEKQRGLPIMRRRWRDVAREVLRYLGA